ncbi:integrase family protein (plasmid) [Ammonifex degensii KC4]|uniref:Integrase family protein n=1 Tax=Ammonifex degensii (strain DSM 10501 / KC4) TaxID=429009 RepID=C9RDI4_AMMDK|nr:tyrosine-type recombinase/integrase [Ammonifex degensii]ACX53255.1 integrase family protein [Ammonifex degensii KC4]
MSDWLSGFEVSCLRRGLSPSSVRAYLGVVRRFVAWWEGTSGEAFDPRAVTPLDVADYRRYLRGRGLKPATVNFNLEAVKSFFRWLKEERALPDNPAEGVKKVPEVKPSPRWLTRREVGLLARAVQRYGTVKDRALFALLLHAGLRVSEAVSLRLEDVVVRERSGFVRVRYGKGGKYREVPLNVTVRRVLKEYLAELPPQGGGWLFPGKKGPMTPRAVQKRLKFFGRIAGVEVTPHKLRHTFCKWLIDAGESLDKVALLAGHARLDTTAVYTRPGRTDLERAVEKLSWD